MIIKNKDLFKVVTFLDTMTLTGRGSLGRTKIKEVISEKQSVVARDESSIIDEYDGWTDKDNGHYSSKIPEMNKAISDLLESEITIEYSTPFEADFVEDLKVYDGVLTGDDADAYAILYDKLIMINEGAV